MTTSSFLCVRPATVRVYRADYTPAEFDYPPELLQFWVPRELRRTASENSPQREIASDARETEKEAC